MTNISGTVNVVLSLIVAFQWLDRRSKNKAIENFVSATSKNAERLRKILPGNKMVTQKSLDICENLKAILNTINGIFPFIKKKG
jgi:hypothetical protein